MTTISAQTILRSRNGEHVLSTLLLRYPRFIHAELMTHRAFSRNAASSRAIPVAKLIEDVRTNPAIPLCWGKNQPGMQAREEHDAWVRALDGITEPPEQAWLTARDQAIAIAQAFADAGYHKQIVNRLLEPFAHITVLVSATEWDNFLELRDHPDAEPHIQMLAKKIRKRLDRTDDIQTLQPGEWHLPFVTDDPLNILYETPDDEYKAMFENMVTDDAMALLVRKLSTARCASTSYKTVDGFNMTLEKAIALHDKLVSSKPIHASPAEHVAQADDFLGVIKEWAHPHQHGNFVGFRQYRHQLKIEQLTG